MKLNKLFVAALLALSSSAFAGIYVGGQTGLIYDGINASNNYLSTYQVLKENDNVLAGRIYVGYEFNKYFSLESGYLLTSNAKITDVGFSNKEIAKFKIKEQIADVSAKVKFYMGDKFFAYGKGGLAYVNVQKDTSALKLALKSDKTHNVNFVYGLGIGYDVTDNLSADASWSHYNGSHDTASDIVYGSYKPSLNFYAVGLTYKF
jgi:opacity protein-like surface antigen